MGLLEEKYVKSHYEKPVGLTKSVSKTPVCEDTGFRLGQRVTHPKLGAGTILGFEGGGAHRRVQVQFANQDQKWLVLAYANLT